MERISVVGDAGSGKTTVAAALASALDVPHVELDGIFHYRPGWTTRPRDEFRAEVERLTAGPGWVIDGNYGNEVQDLVWTRADTVVWLDLPRRVVMSRIVKRTLVRTIRRQELWNGNRERWRNFFSIDPYQSVIVWAWTQYDNYRNRYEQAMSDPTWAHLRFVPLSSDADTASFLRTVQAGEPRSPGNVG